jgi:hypothetical protein
VLWSIRFDALRFLRPLSAGEKVTLRVELPTLVMVPGDQPQRGYSNSVTITFKDRYPTLLTAGSMPDKWTHVTDFVCWLNPGLGPFGYRVIHLDGKGRATVVTARTRFTPGERREVDIAPDIPDKFIALLRQERVWRLESLSESAYPDEGEMRLMFSAEAGSLVGDFPGHVVEKQPALQTIRKEAEALMGFVLKAPAGASALPWGETMHGVQCRLRADRTVWQEDDIPALRAEIRNQDPREIPSLAVGQSNCQLEVDGKWYLWPFGMTGGRVAPLYAGRTFPDTLVTLSPIWRDATDDELRWHREDFRKVDEERTHLSLAPGRHNIRVAFSVEQIRPGNIEGFRVVSNTVPVTVVPSAQPLPYPWPAGKDLTDAIVASWTASRRLGNSILRPDDLPGPEQCVADAIEKAKTVERLSEKGPLWPPAKR